jgi:hypothetical protein
MALFSQDDDDDTAQSAAPDFSGGPVGPDSETETPSPVEPSGQQSVPEIIPADDSAIYGQSTEQPEEEHQDLSGVEIGSEDGAHQYTVPDTSVDGEEESYKPIAPPASISLSPFADHSVDLQALKDQYAREAKENTKPSIWRRIGGSLAGGAVAFGSHNPAEGMKVVDEVLNTPAQNAAARNARAERPLVQQLTNDQAQDQAIQRTNATAEQQGRIGEQNYRNQILAQQDAARAGTFAAQAAARRNAITAFTPDDQTNPYAGGTGTTADGRTIKGVPPPDKWIANWEKQPQNVANAQAQKGVMTLKALEASGVKLTPEQRAIVASGGKVTPSSRTTINIRENPDGSPVAPKSQGGMTQAQKDVILQAKQRDMTAAQNQMASGILSPKDGAAQMQSIQDTFEQKIGVDPSGPGHMTVNPDFTWSRGGQKVASSATQPQQAAPRTQGGPQQTAGAFQYKGQTFTPGQTVMVNGKPAVVKGLNPQTGKLIVGAQ